MSSQSNVPAAERTLHLLETLAAAPAGLQASELMGALNMSRSTFFALLNTLKGRGYVAQAESRGRYKLGPAVSNLLPQQLDSTATLLQAFQADLDVGWHDETLGLIVAEGESAVVVTRQLSSQAVGVSLAVGQRWRLGEIPAGHIILASNGTVPLAMSAIEQESRHSLLASVRSRGYAQQQDEDIVSLACPVCPDGVYPTAAMMLMIPRYRATEQYIQQLLNRLRQRAARLSYRLGASVYQPYGWTTRATLGPTEPMSDDALRAFLNDTWGAQMACVKEDGTPQVVPLWYEWDGDAIWLAASPGASWRAHLQHSPAVSLTISEPWPPLRRALIRGMAREVGDTDVNGGIVSLRQRLVTRYLGPKAGAQPKYYDATGWRAFRIEQLTLSGYQGLGIE